MRRLLVLAALLLVAIGCAISPLGRKQLKLIPDGQMNAMGLAAFAEIESTIPLADDPVLAAYVQCIADAILAEARDETGVDSWELRVFRDETPNAFALPGGRIGVHTGLLHVAETPAQLAAVIGHEVGHVLARHGNERVSTAYAAQAGLGISETMMQDMDRQERDRYLTLLGVGAQLGVLLPYSRVQEREADLIGLDLMARAGFDPRESVTLWENMTAAAGAGMPEFLSTHPSEGTRIRELTGRMPSALALYHEARCLGGHPGCGPPPGAHGEDD